MVPEQTGFHELVLADGPEIEVIFLYLKPSKTGRKLLSPVSKLTTARAQRGADSGEDVSGSAAKVSLHKMDSSTCNIFGTTAPARVNYGNHLFLRIVRMRPYNRWNLSRTADNMLQHQEASAPPYCEKQSRTKQERSCSLLFPYE